LSDAADAKGATADGSDAGRDGAIVDALLESALSGSAPDVRALARAQGMTVGAWTGALRAGGAVEALVFLARVVERLAGVAAARARAEAVQALGRLASDAEGGETARKACVDLLSLRQGEDGAFAPARGGSRGAARAPGRGAEVMERAFTPEESDALSVLDARILGALDEIHARGAPAGGA
jgi:hypothetical protein